MTSGTYTFNYNRDQICRRAARLVGAIASGEIPDAQTNQDFADGLNGLVKRWSASGINVWCQEEGILFLQPSQVVYSIGTGSTDHCTLESTYAQTTAGLAASAGATAIVVSSATGISAGDRIGIQLSTGPYQWTTVNGAPVGLTVNLGAALSQAVPAGNLVVDYPASGDLVRPMRVTSGRRKNFPSGLKTPMNPALARFDYRNLPNPNVTGTPTQFFYDPQLGTGVIYIWPAPPDATNAVTFTAQRMIQDFNVAGDVPDLPQEWIDALVYNLARSMAPEFGTPTEQYTLIKDQAAEYLDEVRGWNREPESIYLGVNYNQR